MSAVVVLAHQTGFVILPFLGPVVVLAGLLVAIVVRDRRRMRRSKPRAAPECDHPRPWPPASRTSSVPRRR
jgi:hypothetical protein